MNRSWITALTLATVAGSGIAFAGVVASSGDATPAAAQAASTLDETAFVRVEPTTPGATSVTYQVGAAGSATLTIANGALLVDSAAPGAGWGITNASGPGTHVEVQYTDGTQLVTFGADLIGSNIAVNVTNAPAIPVTTAAPQAVVVAPTPAPTAPAPHTTMTAAQRPATPAAAPATTAAPAAPRPVTVATTAAPYSGGDDGGNDDHETETNDD